MTSAGFGHRVGKNLAYAYVHPEAASVGCELEVQILGDRYRAVVVEPMLYDPCNERPQF